MRNSSITTFFHSIDGALLLNSEDALSRVEQLLKDILKKLEFIENRLKLLDYGFSELISVSEIVSLLSLPIGYAVDAAKRFLEIARSYKLDPISIDIVKILSICEGFNVSEITRRLRDLRGRASRRIVRERLRILESKGIVFNKGSTNRPKYVLRKCIEESKH
ncbi:MAG: hypothetical protein QXO78_00505 [Desulfurococcaceae archaeon]